MAKQIANEFYTIAHEVGHRINLHKKLTPDNLHNVWHYDANYDCDRFSTLEEAQDWAKHNYDTYKIYKTTVVEETA